MFIAGAVVQWLRDGLGADSVCRQESGDAGGERAGLRGVFMFVPAFAGLGAPHWDQYARGAIAGVSRGEPPPGAYRPRRTRGHRLPGGRRAGSHAAAIPAFELNATARGWRRLRQ